jgi:amino acid adenylation domain-containing protein
MVDKQKRFQELLKQRGIGVKQESSPAPRRDDSGPFPLSGGQRRIWFMHQLDGTGGGYNDPTALCINGTLDRELLRCTFEVIGRRHDVLRVKFEVKDGEPRQSVEGDFFVPMETTVLEPRPGGDSQEQVQEFVNRESARRFDISSEPLIRLSLLELSKVEFVLVVNIHHIVLDGWSKGVMLREMLTIYEALARGAEPSLDPPGAQYRDYVHWHLDFLKTPAYRTQFEYWKQLLSGPLPVLDLPGDKSRPAVSSGKGSLVPFQLSPATLNALNALGRRCNATLFMVLLAVYNILLFRYSQQEDLLVGTPVAGRSRGQWEPLIGLFVNTLVMRNDLSGGPAFTALLDRVRDNALEAFSHQEVPFEKLVEELNPRRTVNITPIFQVMFQLQNAPMPPAKLPGLDIRPLQVDTGFAQVDLSLTMWEQEGLRGTFEYSADLFLPGTIERMTGHFQQLIAAILENPNENVTKLRMLTEPEERRLLVEFNNTNQEFGQDALIHESFTACAAQYPENMAVSALGRKMTYNQLHCQSNKLACYFRQLGVGPETLLAVCLEDPVDLTVAILAILKAGGGYIPLDPQYPGDRLKLILKDAAAAYLVADRAGALRLGEVAPQCLCVEELDSELSALDAGNVDISVPPDAVACVIYTSGSTGIPKGILMEHRSIVNLIESFRRSYTPGPNDRILPLTSIASASFVGELLPILCSGGGVVLAEKIHYLDIQRLKALVKQENITIFSTVPSMIARLNTEDWDTGHLRYLLSGGEALVPGDIDKLSGRLTIVNGYGLTETTICSTFEMVAGDSGDPSQITVGTPLINSTVFVLDKWGQIQPIGVPGEIHIGGVGVSRGYLNKPDATHDGFVHRLGQRLFKTGDRGVMMPDGRLKFLGRFDSQVQIHGFRIELGEIEGHLGMHPQVDDQVALALGFGEGDTRLVAYIQLKKGADIQAGDVRKWLLERLPEYMVPGIFQFVNAIPLNANGKVDVGKLPRPQLSRPTLEHEFIAPNTGIEANIAAVWKEFLKLDKVGIDDNFFDLGGHSLMLAQVHDRLNKRFEQEITVVDLFRYPTVRSLAKYIGENENQQLSINDLHDRAHKRRSFLSRQTKHRRRQT